LSAADVAAKLQWCNFTEEQCVDERDRLEDKVFATSRDFDKAVIALSGGALGVSIAFVRDVFPQTVHLWAFGAAWIAFTLSIIAIFISLLTAGQSVRFTIAELDKGTVNREQPGGWMDRVTGWLNYVAAGLFVGGVFFLGWFVLVNL
jgi:hypothetical protein